MLKTPRSDMLRGWLLGLLAHLLSNGTVRENELDTAGIRLEL